MSNGGSDESSREPSRAYSNLWVIKFDAESRCNEFTEWWMERPEV